MEYFIVLGVTLIALAYVVFSFFRIRKMPEGTEEMSEMAKIIRDGASTFMKTEYKTVTVVVIIVGVLFSLFIEKTAGITFLLGAAMSSAVCIVGMRSAT